MLIASFLKLLGLDYPSLRDAKQRSLAPRVRKLSERSLILLILY